MKTPRTIIRTKDKTPTTEEILSKYNNLSTDKKVGFLEKNHRYILLEDHEFRWTSVTQLLSRYKGKFDGEGVAKQVTANPKNKTYYGREWREVRDEWSRKGREAAAEGTMLHNFGEGILNQVTGLEVPSSVKAQHIVNAVNDLFERGYKLAKTEILLYDIESAVAGQSDILLKKPIPVENAHFSDPIEYEYMIYDWKFLKRPVEKKSYYNRKDGYKVMSGPFKYLHDCNWIHYSIQMAIYQTLTGSPEKVREKVLIVVTDEGFEYVPAYPMRVYWDHSGNLQAAYEIYNGKWYVSEDNKLYKEKPNWIKAL